MTRRGPRVVSARARATTVAMIPRRRNDTIDDMVDRKLLAEMRGCVPAARRNPAVPSRVPRLGQRRVTLIPLSSPSRRRRGPGAVPLGDAARSENGAHGGGSDILASMARRLVRPERRNRPGDPSPLALARPSTHPTPAGLPRDPAERPSEPLTCSRNPPNAQGGLEREVISLRTSIQRKDQDLDAAEKENRELRAKLQAARQRGDRRDASPNRSDDDDFRLDDALALLRESEVRLASSREECAALKRFLADYGMKWVGDAEAPPNRSGSGSGSGHGSSEDGPPRAARKVRSNRLEARAAAARAKSSSPDHASSGFAVDTARLRRSIRELNAVAGEGKGAVVTAPNGERRVEMPTPMALTLWRDGFAVDDGEFRGFEEEKNRAFVRDLVDGYFPYEFKDTHPRGCRSAHR